ncbi:hypothetical protein CN198_17140 [Sinorhizobium meliloti]|nr:hypothetical protein CN198_17140 [Sinorhizobium meliloti]RVK40746.1 hypothetical protein CN163_08980 [Sinorhizobium meliloti]RVK65729.1 hypothetical protein CN159_20640 [Sinorhizobium meliloti]
MPSAISPRSHLCACHRDESSAASAARDAFFQPRTWSGWIPVTSTGMRKSIKPPRYLNRP